MITRTFLTSVGLGLVLAFGFTACGSDDTKSAEVSSAADTNTAPTPDTTAAESSSTESSTATSSDVPNEGTGGQVDAGYITFEAPEGVAWNYSDSPYSGYSIATVHVGSFPKLVGDFGASSTTMADSMDGALAEMKSEMDAFGGGYTEPTQVTYGAYTYWQSSHPTRGIYLSTYDEASGLFIEHVLKATEDGSGFAEDATVQAILASIKYQDVEISS